jgi:uncharacterized protein (TIGR03435 family)
MPGRNSPRATPVLSLLLLAACSALAQFASDPLLFEVASVKESASGGPGWSVSRGVGGRFTAENVPLRALITFAYEIRDQQLTGAPRWIDDDRFDIVAKPDRTVPVGPQGEAAIKGMVRSLLAERFDLVVHRETRIQPLYSLVVAKNGPRMTESAPETAPETKGPNVSMERGQITATGTKMDTFARVLSNQLGRTVIDKTGLSADYDFKLVFAPVRQLNLSADGVLETSKSDSLPVYDGPSIFTALQEQLGVKLESQNGPVDIIVVDRVEKPSAN